MPPPDEPREPFVPVVRIEPRPPVATEFTSGNTSGLSAAELRSLNVALRRLVAAGLEVYEAKVRLSGAVAAWLEPLNAGSAPLERLLLGHKGGA